MLLHARDAARDARATVNRVHVNIEKTMEQQFNRIQNL